MKYARLAPWGILLSVLLSLPACRQSDAPAASLDVKALPAISGRTINVVVEIPAGSNHKIEYQYVEGAFRNDTLDDGSVRVINFLPYPGNYGFIPGTLMDTLRGGDGDALDVLLISEAQSTGTVVSALPIGALLLRDRGEIDTKLIAVPADPEQRVITATNFVDFMLYYDAARRILEDWFLHYKGRGVVEMIRWEDEAYAWEEIRRWQAEEEE